MMRALSGARCIDARLKDRCQNNEHPRTLALLNLPQVEGITILTQMLAAGAPQAKSFTYFSLQMLHLNYITSVVNLSCLA